MDITEVCKCHYCFMGINLFLLVALWRNWDVIHGFSADRLSAFGWLYFSFVRIFFHTKVPSADIAPSLHSEQLDTSDCPPSRSLSEARRAAGCFLDEVRQSIFELWSSSCATADSRTDSKPGRCRTACPWSYKLSNSRIFSTQLKRTSQIPSLVASWAFIFAQSKPGFGQFSFLCI